MHFYLKKITQFHLLWYLLDYTWHSSHCSIAFPLLLWNFCSGIAALWYFEIKVLILGRWLLLEKRRREGTVRGFLQEFRFRGKPFQVTGMVHCGQGICSAPVAPCVQMAAAASCTALLLQGLLWFPAIQTGPKHWTYSHLQHL